MAFEQLRIGKQFVGLARTSREPKHVVGQRSIRTITHIDRDVVKDNLRPTVDHYPERVGEYSPAKAPEIDRLLVRKFQAEP